MIGASVILGLNLTRRDESEVAASYGWPLTCFTFEYYFDKGSLAMLHNWNYQSLITDLVAALGLLSVLATVLEKRIAILQRLKKNSP